MEKIRVLKHLKGGNDVSPSFICTDWYEFLTARKNPHKRRTVKYILAIIGAITFALVGWALYAHTPVIDLMLKIGFGILVVLVVCAIMGAAGINPFKSEHGN